MWRSGVPRGERIVGVVLLLLIVGIGVAIGVKGQHYDPDLFALNEDLLGDAPAPFARVLPVAYGSPSWATGQTVERYGPNNLYEKINGRADQYLAYDVQGLEVQGFTASAGDGRFVDVYLYDMGTPLNAFGIYSAERTPGAETVDLGQEGYDAGGSIFFHAGRFYAQVIPGAADADSLQAARAIATAVEQGLPADATATTTTFDPTEMLPAEGLAEDSVQYVKEDALGLGFLTNATVANYTVGDDYLTVFVIHEASPEAAAQTLKKYREYIERYGDVVDEQTTPRGTRLTGNVSGFYDTVFTSGAWIGGASGASAAEPAQRLADATRATLDAEEG